MKVYLAGVPGKPERTKLRLREKGLFQYRLLSYFDFLPGGRLRAMKKKMFTKKGSQSVELFLDSGAYSAWSQKKAIDLEDYIFFIKGNLQFIHNYSVLDAIGDPEVTLKNQAKMERADLKPIPCFHYGESFEYLKKYLNKYEYISLGGMVPIQKPMLAVWLDSIFSNYICDSFGSPRVKVHGFGMTAFKLMMRYPWYSVDSTSWAINSRVGFMYIPRQRKGKWIFTEDPWKIPCSNRGLEVAGHLMGLGDGSKKIVFQYLEEKGLKYGKSKFVKKPLGYSLQENELLINEGSAGLMVEILIERGVSNDYKLRDEINAAYFKDLQESFQEWPWRMEPKKTNLGMGFSLC